MSSTVKGAALACFGALAGLSWGHEGLGGLVAFAALLPLLWGQAPSRVWAGLVALPYFLASSRGLPFGAGIFFAASAPQWFSWALWAGAGLVNALPWAVFWSPRWERRALGALAALAAGALPPLGIVGWCSPLISAGYLFPGMGLVGLALAAGLAATSAAGRLVPAGMLAAAALVANVHAWIQPAPVVASTWRSVDTHFPGLQSAGKFDPIAEGMRMIEVQAIATEAAPGSITVLPETVLPARGPASAYAWSFLGGIAQDLRAKGATLIAGTEIRRPGAKSLNALVVLGQGEEAGPLVQRVPVPIGMWTPWAADGFEASLLGPSTAEVRGSRVGFAVCYEQLLVWPVVASLVKRPAVLVGAANDWWAKDTSIPRIQGQSLDAWGRLFSVPVVKATNL